MSRTSGEPYHREKAYDWIEPGVAIWYQPAQESRPFAGVVDSELDYSEGELCCRLRDMDERYIKRSGRGMVGRAPWYLLRKRRTSHKQEDKVGE